MGKVVGWSLPWKWWSKRGCISYASPRYQQSFRGTEGIGHCTQRKFDPSTNDALAAKNIMAESPLNIAVPAKAQREPSGSRGRLWAFAVFAAFLALVFLRPLAGLVIYAADSKLNSHVILIPFVSIYLVCINRRQLPETYTFKWGWTLLFLF